MRPKDIEKEFKPLSYKDCKEMLRKADEERLKNIPPYIKEVVDYYRPYIDVANLVDLKKMQTSGEDWDYDMTVFMLNLLTEVDDEFICPVLLDWVFGKYDSKDEAINLAYTTIYEALNKYGYVDEYNKQISKEGGKI